MKKKEDLNQKLKNKENQLKAEIDKLSSKILEFEQNIEELNKTIKK